MLLVSMLALAAGAAATVQVAKARHDEAAKSSDASSPVTSKIAPAPSPFGAHHGRALPPSGAGGSPSVITNTRAS